jgi:hypothetical protein
MVVGKTRDLHIIAWLPVIDEEKSMRPIQGYDGVAVMPPEICAYSMRAGLFCLKHGLKIPSMHGSSLTETIRQG